MASRFVVKAVQAPGMMRHGPFPGYQPSGHRPLEPLSQIEALEKKVAVQESERDILAMENQRLATSHVTLRQDLVSTQHELQRMHSHIGSIHAEIDMQVRGLLENIAKADAEIRASETVAKELQQVHLEGQSLTAARQELTTEIEQMTQDLQKAKVEISNLSQMHAELDGLRQEHLKLRSTFECEKRSNMEHVDQMRSMENNFITMAREVEKLRAEVLNMEKAAMASNQSSNQYAAPNQYTAPNQYGGTFGNQAQVYSSASQVVGYPQSGGYAENTNNLAGAYTNSGFGHGGALVGYYQSYGSTGPGVGAYSMLSGAVYHDGSMMPPASFAGGGQAVDGLRISASVNSSSHDGIRGVAPSQLPGSLPSAATQN
ncbi:hypothetical protein AXF42_Ash011306 [Apostasia shenzhenica]|uniref:Uncharacterized protein n=1 Tax=Apostasia shenzhenica TaxID=1088818 RepID=A0A2I0AE49_9ASPA|nr:hypothetical protein AXF42_Ash011306 [Apostasia shenzhenica]